MPSRAIRQPTRRQLGAVLAVIAATAGATGMAVAQAGDEAGGSPEPRIVDVRYVHRHPFGDAGRRPALVVRAQDPDGQIVAISTHPGGMADGACGLGGKATGQVERWALPVRALRPGRHRVRVTVQSSPCDGTERRARAAR